MWLISLRVIIYTGNQMLKKHPFTLRNELLGIQILNR